MPLKVNFHPFPSLHSLSLLSRYLVDETPTLNGGDGSTVKEKSPLVLTDGLTLHEIAHRTPGYEAGDLIRLVLALRMELLSKAEERECASSEVGKNFLLFISTKAK